MQVLAHADLSAMLMKYESFFLTIVTGMNGTDPMLYRQKYIDLRGGGTKRECGAEDHFRVELVGRHAGRL